MQAITGPAGIVLGLFGGLGGAALEAANKAAEAGNRIYEAAEKTGMSAEALSGVMALAKETGHSFEGLSTTFARATRNIAQAADTGKGAVTDFFSQAELESLKLKPVDEQMHTVLQRIFSLSNEGERHRQLQALLGRGWMENVGILKLLAQQGYGPAIEQAKKLHVFFDEKAAREAHEYSLQMKQVSASLEGLGIGVGRFVMPTVARLTLLLTGNREEWRIWADNATALVMLPFERLFAAAAHLPLVGDQFKAAAASMKAEIDKLETDSLLAEQRMKAALEALMPKEGAGAAAGPEGGVPGGTPKGGKSGTKQQAEDTDQLTAAYGKLVTVLPPATDAMQHFGKAFEPLASGPLSLPQFDKNLSATLGLFQQVPPYTEAAASATTRFSTDLKMEAQALEDTAKAAAHSTLAHLAHALAAGESLRKAAKEAVASIAEQAGVQAVWEAAQGFAMLALNFFIPNPRYVASAEAHFTASAIYGGIAGVAAAASAGMGRGGGGGGGGSAREASYGGGGSGKGAEAGGRGGGPGGGFHVNVYGNMMTDKNSTQQFMDEWSEAFQGGSMWLTASSAAIQGPTTTGRG
jgi:hypothetical protein